jgi:hypothetical protein
MHTVSPYTEFTRVASFPPDFGVTEQLSEFIEIEEESSSSTSSISTSSSSSSSSIPVFCDCCGGIGQEPIFLTVTGFPDAGFGVCNAMEILNGVYRLDRSQFLGKIDINCERVTGPEIFFVCEYVSGFIPFVDPAPPFINFESFEWRVTTLKRGGNVHINVRLFLRGIFLSVHEFNIWETSVEDCTELDKELTFADLCPCVSTGNEEQHPLGAHIECFCEDFPGMPPIVGAPETLEDVVLHLNCLSDQEEAAESSGSSQSPSSQSESSQSEQSPSSPSSSTSSTSSQSLSSQSEQSSQSQSSSSSSTSTSSSSSALGCGCCDPEQDISDTIYVTIHNIIGNVPCVDPCEQVMSPQGANLCLELTKVGPCTWTGIGPQVDGCFPLSFLAVELSCDAVQTTITFTWTLKGDDIAAWSTTVNAPFIVCDQCSIWELNPVHHARSCNTASSWVHVSFGRSIGCCEHCPEQYQVTIAGVAEHDLTFRCTDLDCQALNGAYMVPFFEKGTQPIACGDGQSDWCEYRTDLNMRCTDARFGFCTLSVYIKTTPECGTLVAVEISADVSEVGDECLTVQGWKSDTADDCFDVDVTMDLNNVCQDNNWNCIPDPVTIHVSAPGMLERTALTRLTPIGVPGRRYGA